ncbi:MAG: STAS domain-containing protein, partial [Pseudomonadota bacterium]
GGNMVGNMKNNTDISTHNSPVTKKTGENISFLLPTFMTIETVGTLAAEFKQWSLPKKICVTLDASQVENITSPGLQLIVALEKTLTRNGNALTIIGKKELFIQAFKDAGLENFLGKLA